MSQASLPRDIPDTPRSNAGHLFADVSFLIGWDGLPVGIWRVESEVCHHLLTHDINARFCRYDDYQQCFTEVSRDELAASFLRARQAKSAPSERAPAQKRRLPWLRRTLRNWLPPLLHMLLVRTLRAIRGPQLGTPVTPLTFSASDTFLQLGLSWKARQIALVDEVCRSSGMRIIFYCHDIIPILFPSYVTPRVPLLFEQTLATVMRHADLIICNSESTRHDLTALMQARGLASRRMETVTPGFDMAAVKSGQVSPQVQALLARPCVLYVSTIEKRKNHDLLYRAWLWMLSQGHQDLPHLVIIGQEGWLVDDLLHELRHDPRTRPHITQASNVSDLELSLLYQHALFTVYPSFYEGWGLPLSESLLAGKFCIAANTGSLPEAGGDLAEYLSPYDTVAWAERILFYVRNPVALQQREARIRAEFQPKTWQQFRAEMHALIVGHLGR